MKRAKQIRLFMLSLFNSRVMIKQKDTFLF